MVSLALKSRSRGFNSFEVKLNEHQSFDSLTVQDLKSIIKKNIKLDLTRQRLTTVDKRVLDDDQKPLSEYNIVDGDEIIFKDLGRQISWRTVFLIEYLGPLIIHPLFYFPNPLSNQIYKGPVLHSTMQKSAFAMVMAHFVKRELETILKVEQKLVLLKLSFNSVHRFSNATMPFLNVFKNSFHYWILSGVLLALPIYGQNSSSYKLATTVFDSPVWLGSCLALWTYAELSNLTVHLHLRSLRPPGTKTRVLPYGYGFKLVHCPNYFFESLAWVAFTALTGSWASGLFLSVSTTQMTLWALKKAKNYRKEFGDQVPKTRKAIFPFVL
ncbi:3-oxo-5-alpha-steroid 4-dehydrogenase-domain-containing protein [Melampsora americana]|nr:3-oxo-5-alpha-steroid 4-dehydrogenase-domain-containing protein [Melampsora americana]